MTKQSKKPWVDPRPELLRWLSERLDRPLSEYEWARLERKLKEKKQ